MLKKYIFKFKKNKISRILSIAPLYRIFKLFTAMDKDTYVLIKEDLNFPFIKIGSDFDIYVVNLENFQKKITDYFKLFINYKTTYINCEEGHLQIDLFYKDKFLYKFDLYNEDYKSEVFMDTFIKDVIRSSSKKVFYFFKKFTISIPSREMDAIVRIFELYIYPEKKHHIEILNTYGSQYIKKISDQLHSYSKIKDPNFYLGL